MRILNIARKEIKQNIRNISVMLIMTLMPIAIILILGMAFDGIFNSDGISIGNISVEYMIVGDKTEITEGFQQVMDSVLEDESNEFVEITDREDSLTRLKDAQISCYIEVDENTKTITVYKNNLYNTDSSLIEGILSTYTDRYNAIMEIVKVNPAALANIDTNKEATNYINSVSLQKDAKPNAMDYYGVAMVCVFVMYGMMSPTFGITEEKKRGTGDRMMIAPVRKYEFLIGKLLGSIGTSIIQVGMVILVGWQVFGVNWGENPILPFILILTQIIMAISMGISLGFIFDNDGPAMTITHIFIVLMAFFGGGYMSLEHMGALAAIGKNFSPIWWMNTGIFNLIYTGDMKIFNTALLINISVAIVFLTIAVWRMNKREALANG